MIITNRYFDNNVLMNGIYPQYQNFCGICSVISIINSAYSLSYTQESIHITTSAAKLTKRALEPDEDPSQPSELRNLLGMSNWDIIRLLNTLTINNGHVPNTALVTGENYVKSDKTALMSWLSQPENYIILHTENHYATVGGFNISGNEGHWIVFDSSYKSKKLLHSISLEEIDLLAKKSKKYGAILYSKNNISLRDIGLKDINYNDVFPKESVLKSMI